MRLPIGALVGFFALNAVEVYIVSRYVTEYSTAARIGWIVGYVCAAVLGVLLFWKCARFSVGMTSSWIMYMLGCQVNGWISLGLGYDLNNWIC